MRGVSSFPSHNTRARDGMLDAYRPPRAGDRYRPTNGGTMHRTTGAVAAPSIVRTLVPIAVGYAAAALLRFGIGLDEAALAGLSEFLGGLFAAVYYVLIRAVEQRWPKIGVLLGWAATPDSYSPAINHPTGSVVVESEVVTHEEPTDR